MNNFLYDLLSYFYLYYLYPYYKIDPYDKEKDDFGDGDLNKSAAIIWPISLPIFIFCGILAFFSKIMDFIRKW